MAAEDEREATVMLQIDDVSVSEVKGRDKVKLDQGDLTIFSVPATPEELEHLASLGLVAPDFDGGGVVFAVCGNHKVPLTARIPVLRQEPGHYTFVMPGLFLEMSFPTESTDPEEIEVLELLLRQHAVLRIKGQAPSEAAVAVTRDGSTPVGTVGDRLAGGITAAGDALTGGIAKYTPKVQGGIGAASGAVKGRVAQREQPAEIKQETLDGLRRTRLVTRNAVVISGHVAKAMVGVAQQVGKHIATSAGATGLGQRAGANPKVDEAKKVAQAGVTAAVQVMDAGSQALKAVLTSAVDGIGDVVEHRYGDDAGGAVRDGLGAAVDVVEAGMNVRTVGVKGLAKAAAKSAARTALEEDEAARQSPPAAAAAAPGDPQAA
eukprot:TRINITY_DN5061_c0_g1_i1.p2 TRINITY_DN5061_c0_g1~~TRINITY_DN5061_c0_g1_i1.p2  ORF type:complete len:403 (+),score=130.82 TRINITY_DN5061_c0_g1_i1:80-1210(+)